MGRPKKDPNEAPTTERLLLAAEEEFAAGGFEGARLGDIASKVGISRPSLLYHYSSKHELYASVIRECFARLGGFLQQSVQVEGDFQARFENLVRGFQRFVDDHPAFAKLVLRELLDDKGPGRQILRDSVDSVVAAVELFIQQEGAELVPKDLPVRSALFFITSDVLLRAAADELGPQLWGEEDHTLTLARRLFFC